MEWMHQKFKIKVLSNSKLILGIKMMFLLSSFIEVQWTFIPNVKLNPLNHSREKEWPPPPLKIIIAHPLGKLWMLP